MKEKDKPLLEEQLCFPIYVASRKIIQGYNEYFAELDVTFSQLLVLMALWENDAQPVSSIGQRLHLDNGTLTPLLKRIEAKGLLTRQRSKDDERTVIISLTKKGTALQKETEKISAQIEYDSPLTEEEDKMLKALLNKYIQHQLK